MATEPCQIQGRPRLDVRSVQSALAQGGPSAEAAARQLIHYCRPILRARFFAERVELQDVDDLVSEVLTQVVTSIAGLREPSSFDAWMRQIAQNVLNQHWRDRGRARECFVELSCEGDEADFDTALAGFERYVAGVPDLSNSDPDTGICIDRQLAQLRATQPERHACLELLVQGHTPAEIADHLGRSYGAARQFISQCCAVALNYLAPCLEAAELLGRKRGAAEIDR